MVKTVTIAVKEPSKAWEIREVEDTLKSYQDIVGGYIENFLRTSTGVLMFCNEEGKLLNLKPNLLTESGDLIVGTVFAVRSDEEGEFASLTKEDLLHLRAERNEQ